MISRQRRPLTLLARFSLLFAFIAIGAGCSKSPVTRRLQFNVIPDPILRPLGTSTYAEMLGASRVEQSSSDAKRLRRVGKRISRIADKPMYKWRYALIDDKDTINAWCLPGGKIAFYKGILPVLKNESGMAFVMGHEVGHAVAHHGAERLTQQAAVFGGLTALYMFLQARTEMPEEARNMLLAALGLGIEVGVVLPFSRKHEKEADIIGMMFMARAGYPPEEGIKMWTRMREQSGPGMVPPFLSTHPGHKQRKKNLREWLPAAKKRYKRNKHKLDGDPLSQLW